MWDKCGSVELEECEGYLHGARGGPFGERENTGERDVKIMLMYYKWLNLHFFLRTPQRASAHRVCPALTKTCRRFLYVQCCICLFFHFLSASRLNV